MSKFSQNISNISKMAAIAAIRLYQKTLSLDHGPLKNLYPYKGCKYRPTCSEYAVSAISAHGFWKGGAKAFYRVLRCNPWSKGGYDPADKEKK